MKQQSPIDIAAADGVFPGKITFSYLPSQLHLLNNGYTVQVNPRAGSYVTVGEKRYDLVQYHFHCPSEHFVKGLRFDLEAHLVHQGPAAGLAVEAVLFQQGEENTLLQAVWDYIPCQAGSEGKPEGVMVDPRSMIPSAGKYWAYTGSLTTPPYTEGVQWFVFQPPRRVSPAQIERFTSLFGQNARLVQPLHGRVVLEGVLRGP